jgi:hypothetical protein
MTDLEQVSISTTPGFEPFHEGATEDGLGPEIITSKLNRQLGTDYAWTKDAHVVVNLTFCRHSYGAAV